MSVSEILGAGSSKQLDLLRQIQLPCYDNGTRFTETAKLDRISEILSGNPYSAIRIQGDLFHLYSQRPLESLDPLSVVVLSTHADFVKDIKDPFVCEKQNGVLLGTFDNSATNAAALSLMLAEVLPHNVLVAFTGNEEYGMRGARGLDKYLVSVFGCHPFYFSLDVTNIGYGEKQFSIENTFSLPAEALDKIIKLAKETGLSGYLYPEALADESDEYNRCGAFGCSLCVPTKGPMHSDKGCKMERSAYLGYIQVVGNIACHMRQCVEALQIARQGR